MKVRMKVAMSGSYDGKRWPRRGEVAELPDAVAAHVIANGQAEAVDDDPTPAPAPEVEEAVAEQDEVESAVPDKPVRRRRG